MIRMDIWYFWNCDVRIFFLFVGWKEGKEIKDWKNILELELFLVYLWGICLIFYFYFFILFIFMRCMSCIIKYKCRCCFSNLLMIFMYIDMYIKLIFLWSLYCIVVIFYYVCNVKMMWRFIYVCNNFEYI